MSSQEPYLSLIFPAYNEAKTIGRTLEQAYAWLDAQGWEYEIIVSADGTDGTREAAGPLVSDVRRRIAGKEAEKPAAARPEDETPQEHVSASDRQALHRLIRRVDR